MSIIAVYQRCLANYQMKQWDAGTYALWDVNIKNKIQASIPDIGCIPLNDGLFPCLSDCLKHSQEVGSSNAGCFDSWVYQQNVNAIDFFEYEQSTGRIVHACQVFSGPAKMQTNQSQQFKICLDEYSETGICKLPNIVWSGRSTNKVPIASDHSTIITDPNAKLIAAQNAYKAIQNDVYDALSVMGNWRNFIAYSNSQSWNCS